MKQQRLVGIAILTALLVIGCGGGGGSSSGPAPSQAVSVSGGPLANYTNGIFTSVKVCVPGSTSDCQTIDNVLVDTGSYGLRLLGTAVSLTLPNQTSSSGGLIGECTDFADGFTWGPVVTSDIYLAGTKASSAAVAIIGPYGQPAFPGVPTDCSNNGGAEEDTLSELYANGILGVGVFAEDCGDYCVDNSSESPYYSCTTAGVCTQTTISLADQVTNPVALFKSYSNGIIIRLPSIHANGAATASGTMTLGIGTLSNNSLGSAKIVTVNDYGEFDTNFSDTDYPDSFIDSGSNLLYFASSITVCSDYDFLYCPSGTMNLSAVMTGYNGKARTVSFSVANADDLNGNDFAFDDIAGPTGSISDLNSSFDWGLPFFYGRDVYVAIQNKSTPNGDGPYIAF